MNKQYFVTVWKMAILLTKRYLRDKTAVFFTFIFPLIFLFVFGGLFRNDNISFDVAVIDKSNQSISKPIFEELQKSKVIKAKYDLSFEDAKTKLGRGELSAIVEVPDNFAVDQSTSNSSKTSETRDLKLFYKPDNEQAAVAIISIFENSLASVNQQVTGSREVFKVKSQTIETTKLSRFDYTFSGLLGFSLLSMGIFSMSTGFSVDKKEGNFRRLRTTPLKSSQFIIATGINRLIIGLLIVLTMFITAMLFFDLKFTADILTLLIYIILANIMLYGIGMAVSGWAKNDSQAAPLANIVSFPMMFLSGSFFPRYAMPQWLQDFSFFLPLTPVIDGLRFILTEGAKLNNLGPQLLIIGGWTIIIYIIAFKTFRWE